MIDEQSLRETAIAARRKGRARAYTRAFLRDPITLLSLLAVLAIVGMALIGPEVYPHDPYHQNLTQRLLPPGSASLNEDLPRHWFGTDQLGRDQMARLLIGARISLSVGVLGVLLSASFGTILGLVSGFFRGRTEEMIMRLTDVFMAFPGLVVALFVLFTFGPSFGVMLITMAVLRWPVYARVGRSIALNVRTSQFVESAEALGSSSVRIIWEHILPNALSPLIILGSLEVVYMIFFESGLSFLGFGIQPPDTSWGLMISQGREYMLSAWWLIIIPGLFLFVTALSINLLALWAQDVTDPLQRSRWLRRGLGKGSK